ncbi:hypothetical protein GQ53DRAFT_103260 [Thozetella sp. PMI_491]|nr:hypothetical protein GQ53DRAFT_103260 [Thozetella sp. PMI_491]
MKLPHSLPGTFLTAVLLISGHCEAGFTSSTSFDNVVNGRPLRLDWEGPDHSDFPLRLIVQLIDKGQDGQSVTGYKANIATSLTNTSFTWNDPPYPLNWVPSGLYTLELRSGGDGGGQQIAKSPFFTIQDRSTSPSKSTSGQSSTTSSVGHDGGASQGTSTTLQIALGVVIGVVSIFMIGILGWCFRRRFSKEARARKAELLEEKRRRKRKEFVID